MLAIANPTNARAGRRSHARSANQPATNAAKMKPMTKPKLGFADRGDRAGEVGEDGEARKADEHVGDQRRGAAARAERGTDDDDAERLPGDRHRPQRDRDLGEDGDDARRR